jgi:hypothetical protein
MNHGAVLTDLLIGDQYLRERRYLLLALEREGTIPPSRRAPLPSARLKAQHSLTFAHIAASRYSFSEPQEMGQNVTDSWRHSYNLCIRFGIRKWVSFSHVRWRKKNTPWTSGSLIINFIMPVDTHSCPECKRKRLIVVLSSSRSLYGTNKIVILRNWIFLAH